MNKFNPNSCPALKRNKEQCGLPPSGRGMGCSRWHSQYTQCKAYGCNFFDKEPFCSRCKDKEVVELRKEVARLKGRLTYEIAAAGGCGESELIRHQLDAAQARIRELSQEEETLQEEIDEQETQHLQELASLRRQLEVAQARIQELSQEEDTLHEEIDEQEAQHLKTRKELASLRRQLEEERAQGNLQEVASLRRQLEEERVKRFQEVSSLRRELEEERAKKSNLQELASLRRQLEEERAKKSNLQELASLRRQLEEERVKSFQEVASLRRQLEAAQARIQELSQDEEKLQEDFDEKETQHLKAHKALQRQLEEERVNNFQEVASLRRQLEKERMKKIGHQEVQLQDKDDQYRRLVEANTQLKKINPEKFLAEVKRRLENSDLYTPTFLRS